MDKPVYSPEDFVHPASPVVAYFRSKQLQLCELHIEVLDCLQTHGPLSKPALVASLRGDDAMVTRMLITLLNYSLVSVHGNKEGKRKYDIQLTAAGEALLLEMD